MPAIGKQDPNKVKSSSRDMLGANPELLDAMLAGDGDEGSSTATAEKKGKRRKN